MMHNAPLTSLRLQRVLSVLKTGPATTLEIINRANVCAVNSIVSELRACGVSIDCRYVGLGADKSRIYRYKLKEDDVCI